MANKTEFNKWILEQFFIFQKKQGERTTSKKFAEYIGISPVVISQWFNSRKKPSLKMAQLLEEKLGTPEIYDIIGIKRTDLLKKEVIRKWGKLSEASQLKVINIVRSEIP